MRSFKMACVSLLTIIICCSCVTPERANRMNDIQNQVSSLFKVATTTSDYKDIATPGSVLVLQKDGLLMGRVDQDTTRTGLLAPTPQVPPGAILNQYKDGNVDHSSMNSALKGLGAIANGLGGQSFTRTFVRGEKVSITNVNTMSDGLNLVLMSEVINGTRYTGIVKFTFDSSTLPVTAAIVAEVNDVLKVDMPKRTAQSAPARASAPQTQKVAPGQTRDQVIAILGVPTKVVKLKTKEVDYFPDVKVTLVKNHVTRVE